MPVPVRRLIFGLSLSSTMFAATAASVPVSAQTSCEASYSTLCIALAWEIGDLDCSAVGAFNFPIAAPDSHGFDGDYDGIGCEA